MVYHFKQLAYAGICWHPIYDWCRAIGWVVAFYLVYWTSMRFPCGSPCCRHKPFGVTAILVWMSLMSVISILYAGHYWPATLVHAGLCLSLHCIVRVNDPMHVCSLLFCVCWVWYYTYSVEYYSFTHVFGVFYSTMPCCVEDAVCSPLLEFCLGSYASTGIFRLEWNINIDSILYCVHICSCICHRS